MVDRLLAVLRAARQELAGSGGEGAWIVGGASFGGRVASLALARDGGADLAVSGLLLVSYPLHPPDAPDRLRVTHWPAIDVPVLMLAGDHDPFMTLDLLAAHRSRLTAPLTLITVPGGAHDLSVRASASPDGRRRSPGEAVTAVAAEVLRWSAERDE
jgi:predicted alpha/beta-hydrolase family hydrolase